MRGWQHWLKTSRETEKVLAIDVVWVLARTLVRTLYTGNLNMQDANNELPEGIGSETEPIYFCERTGQEPDKKSLLQELGKLSSDLAAKIIGLQRYRDGKFDRLFDGTFNGTFYPTFHRRFHQTFDRASYPTFHRAFFQSNRRLFHKNLIAHMFQKGMTSPSRSRCSRACVASRIRSSPRTMCISRPRSGWQPHICAYRLLREGCNECCVDCCGRYLR